MELKQPPEALYRYLLMWKKTPTLAHEGELRMEKTPAGAYILGDDWAHLTG